MSATSPFAGEKKSFIAKPFLLFPSSDFIIRVYEYEIKAKLRVNKFSIKRVKAKPV